VFFHQEAHALGQALGDLSAAFVSRAVIQAQVVHSDTVAVGVHAQQVRQFGVAQQSLGGDAADVQAHAAQSFLFYQRGLETQLRRPDSADISARPCANHHDIKVFHNAPSRLQFFI